jgi:hypothetical protein
MEVGMRVFMTRWMAKFVRRAGIADAALLEAILRAERGLIDADLGGGLIKQRVGRPGQGRSGGYRTLIAIRRGDRAVFVYGFEKSDRGNIGADDVADLKRLAAHWLGSSVTYIEMQLELGEIEEIQYGDKR